MAHFKRILKHCYTYLVYSRWTSSNIYAHLNNDFQRKHTLDRPSNIYHLNKIYALFLRSARVSSIPKQPRNYFHSNYFLMPISARSIFPARNCFLLACCIPEVVKSCPFETSKPHGPHSSVNFLHSIETALISPLSCMWGCVYICYFLITTLKAFEVCAHIFSCRSIHNFHVCRSPRTTSTGKNVDLCCAPRRSRRCIAPLFTPLKPRLQLGGGRLMQRMRHLIFDLSTVEKFTSNWCKFTWKYK